MLSFQQEITRKYFQKVNGLQRCLECGRIVKCGEGSKSNKPCTKNLTTHFLNNHKELHDQVEREVNLRHEKENPKICFKKRKVEEVLSDIEQSGASNYNCSTLIYDVERSKNSKCGKFQPTIQQYQAKTTQWEINCEKAKKQHRLLGNLICAAALPLNFVEHEALQHFSSNLNKCYKIPSRKYMTDTVLPDMDSKVTAKVNMILKTADFICLTSDIWTAPKCNDSFISFTAHMLSVKFEDYSFILGCKHFPESHTGAHITAYIHNMLKEADIPKSKVSALVTDNASNMKLGVSNSDIPHVGCFLHVIQLLLNKAIFSRDEVKKWVKLFQYIVKYFKKSPKASQKLKDIQIEAERPTHRLSLDMPVRWNSTFYMFRSCVKLRTDIFSYMIDHATPEFKEETKGLNQEVWEKAKQLVDLLEPFELITTE